MSTVEMDAARERSNSAYKALQYASDNANKAAAECARLELLRLAGQIPGMNGMTFETSYEYDDEGGYFRTISCYPTFEAGEPADYDQYEFIDLMNGYGPEPICVLCGMYSDADQGEITIEQAKERRF